MSKPHTIKIGTYEDDGQARLDVDRLIVSRLLLTAASGGGKSYLLRKMLEGLTKTTQTLVIDTEGEFATLREKRDMVLAGPSGETPAHPRSASLLCRRLMELNLSAVIDVSELARADKRAFVANFINTLVDLPRSLWRPCVVAVDEIHEYAPEGEKSESGAALALLASKGRKRGYCLLGATQRLKKLEKDVAAELKNVCIGQMVLDVDLQRAGDLLGFAKNRWPEIRDLSPPGREGEFFGVGPAFNHRGVSKFRGGEVETTHPKAGQGRLAEPPAPSDKIRSVLDELKDLPQQAEAEIKDLSAAKQRIGLLERELRSATKATPTTRPAVDQNTITELREARKQIAALRQGLEFAMKVVAEINAKGFEATGIDPEVVRKAVESAAAQIVKSAEATVTRRQAEFERLRKEMSKALQAMQRLLNQADVSVKVDVTHNPPFTVEKTTEKKTPRPARTAVIPSDGDQNIGKGERIVLTAIAQHQDGASPEQLTVLTGYKRSTRDAYLQRLREKGMIERSGDDVVATQAGVDALGGDYEPLPTGDALREHWMEKLPDGERKVLEVIVGAYPQSVDRDALDEPTGFKRSTRDAYLQRLTSRRLVIPAGRGEVKAADVLFG